MKKDSTPPRDTSVSGAMTAPRRNCRNPAAQSLDDIYSSGETPRRRKNYQPRPLQA